MGAWGTGIFDNDTSCDVRDNFINLLEEDKTAEEATIMILDEYLTEEDLQELSLVYIGLASIQLEKNCLQEEVREMAVKMIECGDLELWDENNEKEYEGRKQVLTELKKELLFPKLKAPKSTKKRRRIKLGDVFAIPLPNGKYAYGRVFDDAGFGVYEYIGESMVDTPKSEDYQFNVGVYKHALMSGEWTFIENRPFKSEEEAFPPPACIIDSISGEYSIYHKGKIKSATKSKCEGLEIAAAWEANHITDRIMGDDKWHK
jgi:hypothetical protein